MVTGYQFSENKISVAERLQKLLPGPLQHNAQPHTATLSGVIELMIQDAWWKDGQPQLDAFNAQLHQSTRTFVPSQILQSLQQADAAGEQIQHFYRQTIAHITGKMDDDIRSNENAASPTLASLEKEIKALRDQEPAGLFFSAIFLGGGISADLLSAGLSGGAATLATFSAFVATVTGSKAFELEEQRKPIEARVTELNAFLQTLKKAKPEVLKALENNQKKITFAPTIVRLQLEHARKIHAELERYAANQDTTPDRIIRQLETSVTNETLAPTHRLTASLAALLRGDYRGSDIETLVQYGKNAPITSSPDQRALLQFINHAVAPHRDYLEIWAAKMQELHEASEAIGTILNGDTPHAVPSLKIFKGTAQSLPTTPKPSEPVTPEPVGTAYILHALPRRQSSGPDAPPSTASIMEKIRLARKPSPEPQSPQNAVEAQEASKEKTLQSIQQIFNDETLSVQARHKKICALAIERAHDFNKFFGGIESSLRTIDQQLSGTTNKRDRAEEKWDKAASIETQWKLLDLRSPGKTMFHNTMVAAGAEALRFAVLAIAAAHGVPGAETGAVMSLKQVWDNQKVQLTSRFIYQESRVAGSYSKQVDEHKIMRASLEARRKHDPAVLKTILDALDAEVDKLSSNKEFLAYLSGNSKLEDIRAVYMLLPRLVAGENNMEAFEEVARRITNGSADAFLVELRQDNPRLEQAMENFLFGLAGTNDLKVIIAESNMIQQPRTPRQQLLVAFAEEVIKPNYRDYARQASIVDYLQLRNVIPTRSNMHSFNEIMKRENDAALQALLSGRGEFSLVGSNDVQRIFGYYQARHGQDMFVDLQDVNVKAPKAVQPLPAELIRQKSAEIGEKRSADTRIPRLGNIFNEICTHEYLLGQKINIIRRSKLSQIPHVLAVTEMINDVTCAFMQRIASKNPQHPGKQVDALLAQSFVDFFAQLGVMQGQDERLKGLVQKTSRAYRGEGFAVAQQNYTIAIREHALGCYELFLDVYQHNLEKYLECATRENRQALLQQLFNVKDVLQELQPAPTTVMPHTEEARLRAHYRDHSLSNTSHDAQTWAARAETWHSSAKRVRG